MPNVEGYSAFPATS